MRIEGRKAEADWVEGDTILETARRAGLKPPFACQSGACGTCIARVRSGSVEMRTNEVLDADEVASGYALMCQSIPTSDELEVEWE